MAGAENNHTLRLNGMTSEPKTDNPDPSPAWDRWLWALLAAALAVYLRGINYGLVNWDDALARRELFADGLSLAQVVRFFFPAGGTTWQPVRELATALLGVLPRAWGWAPYHVFSVGLFLGSVTLLYAFLRRLFARERFGLSAGTAALAALTGSLVFALHPSHTEVVAWTLGQKDVLVGFFFIACLYFYTRSEWPAGWERLLCLVCYGLALGSKPSAVSLPLVLAAYDRFFRPESLSGRRRGGTLVFYALLLLPAVAAGLYFIGTTARTGAVLTEGGLSGRLARAAGALAFSALKLVLPLNLVHRYPAFDFRGAADFRLWASLGVSAALLGVTAQAARQRRPWGFFLAWFALALLPNMNLVPIRIERADRYYYLSSYAFSALAGWAFARLYQNAGRWRAALAGAGTSAALVLAGLCFVQVGYWKDGPALWGRVAALYPQMPLGHVMLGNSYLQQGQDEQALRAFAPLLRQNPPNLAALGGSAVALAHQGRLREARAFLELGVKLAPQDPGLNVPLARLLIREGDYRRADSLLERILSHDPEATEARLARARLCALSGRAGEALDIYRALDPGRLDVDGLEFLGARSFGDGDYTRAEGYFRRVVQLQPALARGWNNLAVAAENRGDLSLADTLYARAAALDSLYADALFNRGNVLLKLGRTDSARVLYARADSLSGCADPAVVMALGRACLAAGDSAAAAACAARLEKLATERAK
ncbi:tetratricopeptide repeat protein [bacterium]|nr:tetratricopeptide repeat protein [bacterium]